jgi:hypothetical protein
MNSDTLCVCCRRFDEDRAHLFFKCKEVKQLWQMCDMGSWCDRMSTLESADSMVQKNLSLNDKEKILVCYVSSGSGGIN